MNIVRSLILFLLLTAACSPRQTLSDRLMGKWYMHKMIIEGTDVTASRIPHDDQWICFFNDGNFAGEGGVEGRKTGKFTIDETTAVLMLDSDQGPADDSNWIIAFSKDTLIMQGLGSSPHEHWHLYAIRSK